MKLRYPDAVATRAASLLALVLAAATTTAAQPSATTVPAQAAVEAPVPVPASAAEQAVMDADLAFAAQSRAQGRGAAFLAWMGQRPTLFREGAPPLEGRSAVAENVAQWKALELDWHPLHAEVAASGDLAYTWGEYTAKGSDASGKPFDAHGRYVTIWRHENGGWRWVVDIGN